MKNAGSINNMQSKQMAGNKPRPEIRDNLDSRKNEEQMFKGDDVTHQRKGKRSETDKIKNH